MESTTSQEMRGLDAPPGGVPPGRLLFPPQRSALRWVLPAVVVHVAFFVLLLSIPNRREVVEQPIPQWALALTAPITEQLPPDLPTPPAALRLPAVARAIDRAAAAAPSTVQPGIRPPAGLSPSVPGAAAVPGGEPGAQPSPIPTLGTRTLPPAAERLRPGHGDPRLYGPLPQDVVALTPDQLMQLDMDLAIAEVVDSVRAAEAAGRRATDWTYTDSKGRQWGVTPGQIHLGSLTIPLPFSFSAPRTAEAMRAAEQDAEIEAQAQRMGTQAILRDRAAEIRRRRNEERAKAAAAAATTARTKSTTASRPDSTGGE